MGDERFTTQRETSRNSSKPSTNQLQLYASQRAEVLFGCYRRSDANDPERYVAAVAAVLSLYDFELIREVTDPRTGIMTTEKFAAFMPNAGELRIYCEAQAARKDRLKHLGERRAPSPADRYLAAPPPLPGDLANVHIPATNVRYAGLVEWAKTAEPRLWRFGKSSAGVDGIWVALDVWDQRATSMKRPVAEVVRSFTLSEAAQRSMRQSDENKQAAE